MAAQQQSDYLFKILILGDSSVGKSCILLKFVDDKFQANHNPTIGIDFKSKILNVEGKKVKMQLWDTAGQERFKIIVKTLYNGVSGIVLAYSIDNRTSFQNIESWMKQIKQNVDDNVAISLIGNKSDLPDRKVQRNEGEMLAESYKVPFYETSAQTGANLDVLFSDLAHKILKIIEKNPELYKSPEQQQTQALTPQPAAGKKEKGCC